MKMRKISLLGILFLFIGAGNLFAQTIQEEFEYVQKLFGKEKKLVVEAVMDLSPEKAAAFWPVYESYEKERTFLAKERMQIIYDFLNKYSVLSDIEANDLANRTIKNDLALAKLHSKYFKKFKKAVSAHDAAKFMQLDTYIHNTIRNAIQQELPFIDEFK